MHLLATTPAGGDGDAAVDLGQTPGDIVVLSAADSELAALAAARRRQAADAPSLRLASLLRLAHPLSVDLHVERVIAHARLVVVRLLGGRGYWSYGLERVAETCRAGGIDLAVLPGDERPDPELAAWSTLAPDRAERLWRYLVEGGPDNADGFLALAAALIGRGPEPPPAVPVPRAGLYRPGHAGQTLGDVPLQRPRAVALFYRALLQAGDLAPVDALLAALDRAGLEPV
ncbi:MAG: cobaltochelatase subunit CobN, partial [Geminicoccaceae bacterium]